MGDTNAKYAKKFAKRLGTVSDFVDYVDRLERQKKLSQLGDFKGTDGTWDGKRYLLVKKGGVVDFRHFFPAMMQRLEGARTKNIGVGSTTEGTTLLLGVLNEINQCIGEGAASKLNSCFSREDLFSNRVGARFGEAIVIKRAEANRQSVATHLRTFLGSLQPLAPDQVKKLQMQSTGEVVLEAVGAVLTSLSNALIPSAY